MNNLIDVRNYIRTKRKVHSRQMKREFKGSTRLLDALIEKLVLKGVVEILDDSQSSSCSKSGCNSCNQKIENTVYCWKEKDTSKSMKKP